MCPAILTPHMALLPSPGKRGHREREQEDALVHSGSSACPVRIDMAFPSLPLESLSSLSLSLPLKNRSDYP